MGNNHVVTANRKGFMHPLSTIAKQFVQFSKDNYPVLDMGCAYGNVTLEGGRPIMFAFILPKFPM